MIANEPYMRITAPSGDVYLACTRCIARMVTGATRWAEDGHLHLEANLGDFAWRTWEALWEHVATKHPAQ